MKFSRTLALIFGLLAPIAETVRRWHSWRNFPPALFDDYIMGAFLLAGAWLVGRNFNAGPRLLAAAWGVTCGLGYNSFFMHIGQQRLGIVDPGPLPSIAVATIKGIGLLLAIVALALTLAAKEQDAEWRP